MPSAELFTDAGTVLESLRIVGSAQVPMLNSLIAGVSAAITRQLGRFPLLASNPANPVTRFLSGKNTRELVLPYTPVQAPVKAGCVTGQGSAVVTVPDTQYLFVNQSVAGPGLNTNAGSAIASINSATQITLNQPCATTQASASLIFGLGIWMDARGYGGTGPGAFGAATQQYEGIDFYLDRDGASGNDSRKSILYRIRGLWSGENPSFWGGGRGFYPHLPGSLTTVIEAGRSNIKIQGYFGYDQVPEDMQLAATRLTAYVYRELVRLGLPLVGEAAQRMAVGALGNTKDVEIGGIRSLLAAHRNKSL